VIAAIAVLVPLYSHAWLLVSRELVDVEFGADEALTILVSAPSKTASGLYRLAPGESLPARVCGIASPSFFSFDRKTILERVRGAKSTLRVYQASTCRLLAGFKIDGVVLDADFRAGQLVAAVRDADRNHSLRLYSRRGKLLTSAPVGRNIEMGFAPDGRSVVNFDLSDSGVRVWQLPRLARSELPAWARAGELTFVPGAQFAKHYLNGKLHVVRWPGGASLHAVASTERTRLRQLSRDGHAGVLHLRTDQHDLLEWIDFGSNRRLPLARGSIDNAALSADGRRIAWTLRNVDQEGRPTDLVEVRRSRVGIAGNLLDAPN